MTARLNSQDADFEARLAALLTVDGEADDAVDRSAAEIIADVRRRGDAAVLEWTRRFDDAAVTSIAALEVSKQAIDAALSSVGDELIIALEIAADRIRRFHQVQRDSIGSGGFRFEETDGSVLGQIVNPIDRVGIYVPGGKAAYPSSVLMNAIPAKVAGVGEIVMVTPVQSGGINPLVLAAASIAGVDRLFTIGGAQAIAALAYGTESIPAVDKIVGPGNAYVAAAKRRVFGVCGIDMIAGPSEIVIIADGSVDPDWLAMDVFSQAEHDEMAQSILLSPDAAYLDRIAEALDRLLPSMPRKAIIETSLANRGALIQVRDLDEACAIVDRIAPEHLEVATDNPHALLPKLRHAGAIFLGQYTSETLGDYCAGPNHVLPTSRTARFSSPLGVYDFQKRTSLIEISHYAAQRLGRIASVLARGEGLIAHATAAELRLDDDRR
ncbi:histidinol dehydrogenase [soil metagenome]